MVNLESDTHPYTDRHTLELIPTLIQIDTL